MKRYILASTLIISLLTVVNAQALETGGKGGMRLPSESKTGDASPYSEHHKYQGSSLHEAAAAAHTEAAKHHKKAAGLYRTSKDSKAIVHAEAAITSSEDAFEATKATKAILPKK